MYFGKAARHLLLWIRPPVTSHLFLPPCVVQLMSHIFLCVCARVCVGMRVRTEEEYAAKKAPWWIWKFWNRRNIPSNSQTLRFQLRDADLCIPKVIDMIRSFQLCAQHLQMHNNVKSPNISYPSKLYKSSKWSRCDQQPPFSWHLWGLKKKALQVLYVQNTAIVLLQTYLDRYVSAKSLYCVWSPWEGNKWCAEMPMQCERIPSFTWRILLR